jgi:hypothetical protein
VQCIGTFLISCGFIYLYFYILNKKTWELLTNNFMGSTVTTENREEKLGEAEIMGASYGKLMMWFYRI